MGRERKRGDVRAVMEVRKGVEQHKEQERWQIECVQRKRSPYFQEQCGETTHLYETAFSTSRASVYKVRVARETGVG